MFPQCCSRLLWNIEECLNVEEYMLNVEELIYSSTFHLNLHGRQDKWINGRQHEWKTALMGKKSNGRWPKWNITSMEYDLNGRQSQCETTSPKCSLSLHHQLARVGKHMDGNKVQLTLLYGIYIASPWLHSGPYEGVMLTHYNGKLD